MRSSVMEQQSKFWRDGAVILAISSKPPHGMLFVERGHHLRRHPGEIGLPGGAADEVDAGDPVKTALRELHEELNVGAGQVRIAGTLPAIKQRKSAFVVKPVIGVLDAEATYSIDGDEIVGVFSVPLPSIVEGGVYEDRLLSETVGRPMYALDFEGRHIWGFTARILKSFVDAWNSSSSPVRAAIESLFKD